MQKQLNNFPKKSFRPFKKKDDFNFKKNEEIVSPQIRVVEGVEEKKIYSLQEALQISKELGLDLIEVVSNSEPPICKIMDYNKLIYQERRKKKELERKNKEKQGELKEVRFTPNTDTHDFDFKTKQCIEWLKDGNKVKASLMFKGRQIIYREQGEMLLLKVSIALKEYGRVDQLPKLEGKRMTMIVVPKKKK